MFTVAMLVQTIVLLIVVGLVFWLLRYLIDVVPMFGPYKQVANVILVVLAVLVLISILLSLVGYPVVRW